MTDLTRRFFLGGAISLIAVQASAMPKIMGNMPQIWGDGSHDDTGGISALLRSEPVVFTKDKVTVDSHQGITFHRGLFKISRTLEIPEECNLTMDRPTFRAPDLENDEPFFRVGAKHRHAFASGSEDAFANVIFMLQPGHGPIIHYPPEDDWNDAVMAKGMVREANGDIHWAKAS